ncbi:hypothetical protein [Variovorax sp. ZT4R33]|uniref:hypothetical protein n=1 Tax=Variovorax sp. ZT4R33 TaxID=3443743 RepID=UPI003F4622DB
MDAIAVPCVAGESWHASTLRRDAVPETGRPFFGLALRLGVFEEGAEREAVAALSENDRRALLFFRKNFPVEVDQWLTGDEAMARLPSPEYRVFSCLYFAAEYLCKNPKEPEAARTEG